ncbi:MULTISPECIES: ABC transporter ATP-binding protein [unclassified Crossiella]|uniref:ABC transporter ATP-binding protein n=1 Tax=unclassified Crossiella TaxID=2620835 RepID=UPI001FFEC876|nr:MULTISPECIES: ABC transporter ATP-binding protein [unclassified Crossiella]MCK2239181.1 ABC transporter ATP-binding protein [Crossiella sp. S99.2]MCK2251250.1 ABC transporter ATP-binding protein [Crossiella sp. S99.1]
MAVIEVEGLRKRYRDTVAVRDIGFSVAEGEIFGIAGLNGAGKTTTVECIEGLRRPSGGRVRVLGLDPWRDRARLRQVVGSQLQDSMLPEKLRVGEALRLFRSFYRDGADPETLLGELGIETKRHTAFEDLSGGQRQRLSIALALIGKPRIVVLDELTTGLDPVARRRTWELIEKIRAGGVTVVLVTHFMDEADRLCDRLAIFHQGSVAALDHPAALRAQLAASRGVLDVSLDEVFLAHTGAHPELAEEDA